jgi:hypothetical protein
MRLEVFQVTLIESIVCPNPPAKPSCLAIEKVALKYIASRHACVQESTYPIHQMIRIREDF